jgi:hypothetical protein
MPTALCDVSYYCGSVILGEYQEVPMSGGHARRLMAASAISVAGIAVLVACEASHGARPSDTSSSQPTVRARLADIPATITAGGAAVQFTAAFTNNSNVTEHDVAPLFQIVGGPCNCALGSLERFDSSTGTWRAMPMPEGDGDPHFLARATGGTSLRPGATITFRYRLAVDARNPAKPVRAVIYAVQMPTGKQLGFFAVDTRLIKS